MGNTEAKKLPVQQAAENLFNFAIDRTDIKEVMLGLHEDADINRNTVEYELPILKIITVGWSISYFISHVPYKNEVSEIYWNSVREFSQGLSETAELMAGKTIDYFQVLKDRLNMYVDAMNKNPDAEAPAVVIGPEFAGVCGNRDDVFTVITGSRLFIATAGSVKSYLEEVKLR
ncbi:MAG: hypothetical protein HF978_18500 [Desulfobacteraceae bacterium]|nr:hypothetical protein [Desulfobacteraceae bacterium]MBC2757540.1 hypothetical protein [Desulfobacteraceae bacterium]